MKKFTILIALCALAFTIPVQAQSGYFVSASNSTTKDTVTNTAAKTQTLAIAGYQADVSIQVLLSTLTGTPAGVVRVFGSNNGLTFTRIATIVPAGTTSGAVDSLNVNVNALTKIFIVPKHAFVYYRTVFTGSGTQATTFQTYAIWRKP